MLWLLRRPWFRFSHFKGKEEIHFPTRYLRSRGAPQSLDIHLLNYVEILDIIIIIYIFFFYRQALFKTVHLNLRGRNRTPGFLITGEERDGGADVYLNWLGFLVVMIMNWALGAVYARGRERGGGEGEALCEAGRWLAGHRVDNGNISLLGSNIMLKVNGSWRMEDRNDSEPVSRNGIFL